MSRKTDSESWKRQSQFSTVSRQGSGQAPVWVWLLAVSCCMLLSKPALSDKVNTIYKDNVSICQPDSPGPVTVLAGSDDERIGASVCVNRNATEMDTVLPNKRSEVTPPTSQEGISWGELSAVFVLFFALLRSIGSYLRKFTSLR